MIEVHFNDETRGARFRAAQIRAENDWEATELDARRRRTPAVKRRPARLPQLARQLRVLAGGAGRRLGAGLSRARGWRRCRDELADQSDPWRRAYIRPEGDR
jgi:hypothetical protein